MASNHPIGVLYEHPEWFKVLFAELDRRGTPYERLFVDEHWFDPAQREAPYSLVVNRVSPSSYMRGHAGSILYARQVLAWLRDVGVPVVNGYDAYTLETSKALQLLLFERLGVRYPMARVVNHPSQLERAAEGLQYPVIVKPNVGGSGALMQRFESPAQLREAAQAGVIDFGIDRTALVQEYLAPAESHIVRVEVLNGEFLYGIQIETNPDEGFNLCPADICRIDGATGPVGPVAATPNVQTLENGEACDFGVGAVSRPALVAAVNDVANGTTLSTPLAQAPEPAPVAKRPLNIKAYTPPQQIVDDTIRIVKAGGLDVGGVEYLVAGRDGQAYFYDVNALSNFVTDAVNVVGFDPTARFVDYLEARAGIRQLTAV